MDKDLAALIRAVEFVEWYYPLPRCDHGNALRDHAGENLFPSCGCTAGTVGVPELRSDAREPRG